MLQCVVMCCSVLQCVAVCCHVTLLELGFNLEFGVSKDRCCSVLQCVVMCCSVWQCVAMCCNVLQCFAMCCSVLQCVVMCCSVLQCVAVQNIGVEFGVSEDRCCACVYFFVFVCSRAWGVCLCVYV